jgi:hypothetical protein
MTDTPKRWDQGACLRELARLQDLAATREAQLRETLRELKALRQLVHQALLRFPQTTTKDTNHV